MKDRPTDSLALGIAHLHAPAAAALVMADKERALCIQICESVAHDFHELMMAQIPGSRTAQKFAHLSEGAIACIVALRKQQ